VVVDVANAGDGRVQSFPALELHGGDELRVFPVTDRVRGLVRISGHVWNPGPQGHRPGLTLSAALRAAGGLRSDAYLGQVSVTRLRPDSTRAQMRATVRDTTGALVEDMVLQEDDEVTVFSLTDFRPERFVAIGGSVRKSGQFPWRAGMTLRDLVLEAGGLTEDAYLREAEVARVPEDRSGGRTANTLRVPLDSSYVGDYVPGQAYPRTPGEAAAGFRTQPEVELQPYDNVLIMQRPDWQPPRSVILTGEVRFPGRYTLVSKSERLSEVVRRAGGLTEDASADAAFFGRVVSATSFRAATERGDELALEDDSMPPELERTRVGLDLGRALMRGRSADNLVLFEGDSLHVPFRRTTVEIQGAVNAPSIITHSGRRIGYYLSAAGGSSASGNERRAYVIQPNGKIQSRRRLVWVIALDPKPREGATVVVPAGQDNGEGVQRIVNTVQIIAQTLASVATLVVLLR
jgi:protein involved in polysaccharide export with SLBB domain